MMMAAQSSLDVEALIRRDPGECERLLAFLMKSATKVATRFHLLRHEVDDLVGEVAKELVKQFPQLRDRRVPVEAAARQALHLRAVDLLRRRSRRAEQPLPDDI